MNEKFSEDDYFSEDRYQPVKTSGALEKQLVEALRLHSTKLSKIHKTLEHIERQLDGIASKIQASTDSLTACDYRLQAILEGMKGFFRGLGG